MKHQEQIEAYWSDPARERELVGAIARLVNVKSVKGDPEPGKPFGPGPAAALDEALALCRELKKRTDEDLQNNVIARFHDESQLNRLVAETPGKFRILPPDYCTPEETPTGHEAILVLQKSRCINVESVKGAAKPQNFFQRKWEAFRLNWLPYLWLARDTLLRRRIDFKNDL